MQKVTVGAVAGSRREEPRLKDFVFLNNLGSGTYATVYKARRKSETVAVKCIAKRQLNKSAEDNLLREIELLKGIEHNHVVKLLDFQWDRNFVYLIMEYCNGGDLSQFIHSKKALPEKLARKFLQQLALALQFLHERNIAHMDLKPQNILLCGHGHSTILKVADFGFALHLKDDGGGSTLRGSPLYMAPEIICCQKYDARVDLWSVGVILFETLFGQAPFVSSSYDELIAKLQSQEAIVIPPAPPLSANCHSLLAALLQRDPKVRISFEDFFSHPFIDLEHMPGPLSRGKGAHLLQQAVQCDSDGEAEQAVQLYCMALDYLIPLLDCQESKEDRSLLRKKVQQYIERSEKLKDDIRQQGFVRRPLATDQRQEMDKFAETNAEFRISLQKVNRAQELDEKCDFDGALVLYKEALSTLIVLVQELPKGKLRSSIAAEVKYLMRRAEEVKTHLQKSVPGCEESSFSSHDSKSSLSVKECVIQ